MTASAYRIALWEVTWIRNQERAAIVMTAVKLALAWKTAWCVRKRGICMMEIVPKVALMVTLASKASAWHANHRARHAMGLTGTTAHHATMIPIWTGL